MDVAKIAQILSQTLSNDAQVVHGATESLDRLSSHPELPFALLYIASGNHDQGQKIAAAAYLKNLSRRNIEGEFPCSKVSKGFKDELLRALFQAEPKILKVLVEVFHSIVINEFVKQNSWPELVSDLCSAIQNSNLFNNGAECQWNAINTLSVLCTTCRPFQYFLNPKDSKEPVPPQLELLANTIIVPLLAVFHRLVQQALSNHDGREVEIDKILSIVCKCVYFCVRSHMPSSLVALLPLFCCDLIGILDSIKFEAAVSPEYRNVSRLKTTKRSLLIFCVFVTRHRKHTDKLMPHIIKCVLNIVNYGKNAHKLDFLSERIISLAFDVISHVLETGRGWRLVSPHFSTLVHSGIFPSLIMNEKDVSEWEDDPDEYLRKNLPSDLEEVSGWREDLYTARKSAINLLGVIAMSKGPPTLTHTNGSSASSKRKKGGNKRTNNQCATMGELVVLPFLLKYPIPSDANASQTSIVNSYYGVLIAYGGLLDFLREQQPGYVTFLIRARVLPLYAMSTCLPYLIASANWVLGELASCLPEEICAEIYSSLVKALSMPDKEEVSFYPVRVSAAGAIAKLLENDYLPPEWLPLLQVVIGGIGQDDEENSILFQLLSSMVEAGNEKVAIHIPHAVLSLVGAISKSIPPNLEPWPQVVERGFAALSVMAQSWENFILEKTELDASCERSTSDQATISGSFSSLLQEAWLAPMYSLMSREMDDDQEFLPPPSCIDHSSRLLQFIMSSVTGSNTIVELKIYELVSVWADLIADWHSWEESEDFSVFNCIMEVVRLNSKYALKNFFVKPVPSPPAPPVSRRSIVENIGAFISHSISQYPSATWKACSCIHMLLNVPNYSFEAEGVKESLVVTFSQTSFSRFKEIQSKPSALWKPLLLSISTCYLCHPDTVERLLEKYDGGFTVWVSALGYICRSSFAPGLSAESEIKLIVMTLAKVVERIMELGKPRDDFLWKCFGSLMEASIQLKEAREENEEESDENEEDDDNDDDSDDIEDHEDSDADELEETEQEFLDRYAKAAIDLENSTFIEEGDVEDHDQDIELGWKRRAQGQSSKLMPFASLHQGVWNHIIR
ncbi:importin beta-like SAD2 homolog isoform X2 [Benincasa hispida]|uniref:importin beta-like SAD2 homolog isoform X2 n=1 Tax=Benincasa hispida TaxID=102211 RepID=UPI0019016658|nr:importin beta-like SAD2 homolog isoform X2 [Benincasa hispida]XP_038874633.1 importin beta-like SAD2 homolog isoform X2 [Benincasa hispida]